LVCFFFVGLLFVLVASVVTVVGGCGDGGVDIIMDDEVGADGTRGLWRGAVAAVGCGGSATVVDAMSPCCIMAFQSVLGFRLVLNDPFDLGLEGMDVDVDVDDAVVVPKISCCV
jgi:hypothetical protein